jgi:hypothetical protein
MLMLSIGRLCPHPHLAAKRLAQCLDRLCLAGAGRAIGVAAVAERQRLREREEAPADSMRWRGDDTALCSRLQATAAPVRPTCR